MAHIGAKGGVGAYDLVVSGVTTQWPWRSNWSAFTGKGALEKLGGVVGRVMKRQTQEPFTEFLEKVPLRIRINAEVKNRILFLFIFCISYLKSKYRKNTYVSPYTFFS